MSIDKQLGRRIRAARIERGWSIEKLAELLDVSRTAVWLWEKGTTAPRRTRLPDVASILGLTLEQLVQ